VDPVERPRARSGRHRQDPGARVRDLAAEAGLTERTTQAIIADLEAAGYLTRRRVGRRAEYTVHTDRGFRHRCLEGLKIGPFLDLLAGRRADDVPDPCHDADSEIGHGLGAPPDAVAPGEFSCVWHAEGDRAVAAVPGDLDQAEADGL